MRRYLRRLVVLASLFVLLGATAPVAPARPASCVGRTNNTIAKLLECVDLEGVREHQAESQAIADANGGTRAARTAMTNRPTPWRNGWRLRVMTR